MEHTCVQTHSHSRPSHFEGWFTIHALVNHEPWRPVSFCSWNNTSGHKEPDTCYRSHTASLLRLPVSISYLFLLFPPHLFFMAAVSFFFLPSLNSSPDSQSVYMSVYTNPHRRYSHAVTHRQTLYKPCYSTLTWIRCISNKWLEKTNTSSYWRWRCEHSTITWL